MVMKLSELSEDELPEETNDSSGLGAFARGLLVGLAKSAGQLGVGLGELGSKVLEPIGYETPDVYSAGSPTNVAAKEALRPSGFGQSVGKFAGDVAQFAVPTSQIVRGQQLLRGAASNLPGVVQTAARAGARFVPEAVGTGAVSLARSGGDVGRAREEALFAGGASVGLGALGKIARSTYFPELADSVSKALSVQGKVSGAVAMKELGRKVSGLAVLKKYAPRLAVRGADGAEEVFNPSKATYDTTLQAWNEARKSIFNQYNELAQRAGDKITVDLTPVYNNLIKTLDEPRLEAYHKAAEKLFDDINRNFKNYKKADIRGLQTFLADLNSNTAQGFLKGTAENATAEINAGAARALREQLDRVITETTGEKYAALRSEYAALKSIEDDLVRKFRQAARKTGGGLQDYVDIFSSGDIVAGVLYQQPQMIATGLTRGFLGQVRKALGENERFLRRSFDLIDKDDANELVLRLFGGSKGR